MKSFLNKIKKTENNFYIKLKKQKKIFELNKKNIFSLFLIASFITFLY